MMFWLKFNGDSDADVYRYHPSTHFDNVVTSYSSLGQDCRADHDRVPSLRLYRSRRCPQKTLRGSLARVTRAAATVAKAPQGSRRTRFAGCTRKTTASTYGGNCVFKHVDAEEKEAPVRQVLLGSSTEVNTRMVM